MKSEDHRWVGRIVLEPDHSLRFFRGLPKSRSDQISIGAAKGQPSTYGLGKHGSVLSGFVSFGFCYAGHGVTGEDVLFRLYLSMRIMSIALLSSWCRGRQVLS